MPTWAILPRGRRDALPSHLAAITASPASAADLFRVGSPSRSRGIPLRLPPASSLLHFSSLLAAASAPALGNFYCAHPAIPAFTTIAMHITHSHTAIAVPLSPENPAATDSASCRAVCRLACSAVCSVWNCVIAVGEIRVFQIARAAIWSRCSRSSSRLWRDCSSCTCAPIWPRTTRHAVVIVLQPLGGGGDAGLIVVVAAHRAVS